MLITMENHFNDNKILLAKSGETSTFSKTVNTLEAMRDVIKYQEQKIAELEGRLLVLDSERDEAFKKMYQRAIKAEERVKDLEEEVKTLTQRCDKFRELNLLQKK